MQYPLVFSAENEKPRFSFLKRGFAVLRQPTRAKNTALKEGGSGTQYKDPEHSGGSSPAENEISAIGLLRGYQALKAW
jgi:hypothetical protein